MTTKKPLRSISIWATIALIAYLFFNVVQSLAAPMDFAARFGVPDPQPGAAPFVAVYGIRTLFIAVFGAVLLALREFRLVSTFLLLAVLMPIGDALLVALTGGAPAIVVRHVAIAIIVVVTGFFLRRWSRHQTPK
jgi:hypothetical protein